MVRRSVALVPSGPPASPPRGARTRNSRKIAYMPSPASSAASHARLAAAKAIAGACRHFPDIGPVALDVATLSPADTALATAIHRTTLQRWLTLEHLLNRVSRQPMAKLEPSMRAVLLTGAAQLLFMPGTATYAAVDESVKLAAKLVRPQAKSMVNAVLRKIAALPARWEEAEHWTPARDRLPLPSGTLHLNQPALPRTDNLVKHLTAATSHPEPLINRWVKQRRLEPTTRLCLHNLQNPPTIVVAPDLDPSSSEGDVPWIPHEQPGFIVWTGTQEALRSFLADDPRRRRVQDPSSYAACKAAASTRPTVILDFCAGLGTKTRQLATMHPAATVLATDIHAARRQTLAELPATFTNVQTLDPDEALSQRCDLLLLDVPCSNSGVLPRRPEARYRLTPRSLEQLVSLQRQIIEQALPTVNREGRGHVLYTTCSIEPEENQKQAQWLADRFGGRIVSEKAIEPGGHHTSYHDGSYHALIEF